MCDIHAHRETVMRAKMFKRNEAKQEVKKKFHDGQETRINL